MRHLSLLIHLLAIFSYNKFKEVTISTGRILGTIESTIPNGNKYYSFKGIRYAEKPQRFQPPVPANSWEGLYDATKEKHMCIQAPFPKNNQSEDCLFLNVYTPQLHNSEENQSLAVMVWIYGGGFNTGNCHFSEYNPEYLIDENVVVVTINYRLNSFGFLSSGDDILPGNNGIRDLLLGLEWVHNNIHVFSGDPNKVTIFGQSAGAALVSYLIISPVTDGKGYFQKAILESGNALSAWAFQRNPREDYERMLNYTNCNHLDCLQNATTAEILEAQNAVLGDPVKIRTDAMNGLTFSPVIDNDIIPIGAYEYLKKNPVPNIPVIMGINSEEGLALEKYLPHLKPFFDNAEKNPAILVPENMYALEDAVNVHIAPKLISYYFNNNVSAASPENIIKYISGTLYNKPMREYFSLAQNAVPSYCYQFSYIGKPSSAHKMRGVGHAEEIGYVWKNFWNVSLTANDLTVKSKVIRLWANFAKTGNPTPNEDELLDNVIWNRANVDGTNVSCLNVDEKLSMFENPKEEEYQMWRHLYGFGNPKDTY